jgi:hypothetical protein
MRKFFWEEAEKKSPNNLESGGNSEYSQVGVGWKLQSGDQTFPRDQIFPLIN